MSGTLSVSSGRKCALLSPQGQTGRTGLLSAAAPVLSATSQGNMKTEIQVVCEAFVRGLGAVVCGKPSANLQTKAACAKSFMEKEL